MGQFGVQPVLRDVVRLGDLHGRVIGSLMWFNVWFIIWPAQQVVMASTARVKEGGQAIPEAAARGARGGVAPGRMSCCRSRCCSSWARRATTRSSTPTARGAKIAMLIVFLVILAIVEGNAVVGPATPDKASAGKKLLATVKARSGRDSCSPRSS